MENHFHNSWSWFVNIQLIFIRLMKLFFMITGERSKTPDRRFEFLWLIGQSPKSTAPIGWALKSAILFLEQMNRILETQSITVDYSLTKVFSRPYRPTQFTSTHPNDSLEMTHPFRESNVILAVKISWHSNRHFLRHLNRGIQIYLWYHLTNLVRPINFNL